jgi:hypothetical protein
MCYNNKENIVVAVPTPSICCQTTIDKTTGTPLVEEDLRPYNASVFQT